MQVPCCSRCVCRNPICQPYVRTACGYLLLPPKAQVEATKKTQATLFVQHQSLTQLVDAYDGYLCSTERPVATNCTSESEVEPPKSPPTRAPAPPATSPPTAARASSGEEQHQVSEASPEDPSTWPLIGKPPDFVLRFEYSSFNSVDNLVLDTFQRRPCLRDIEDKYGPEVRHFRAGDTQQWRCKVSHRIASQLQICRYLHACRRRTTHL